MLPRYSMQPCPGCGVYVQSGYCDRCAPLYEAQWQEQQRRRYAAEAPLRNAERANDREMWELSKRDFNGLTPTEQEKLLAWSVSFTQYTGYSPGSTPSMSYDDSVIEVDAQTTRSLEGFLKQAVRMPPTRVEVNQRTVKVKVAVKHEGLIRRLGPKREVTRRVGDYAPGYEIFRWEHDHQLTNEAPIEHRVQQLYAMIDGTMRLHGGYQYSQVRKCGRPGQPNFTAGFGELPGFLSPHPSYTRYGPLIPGLPHEIAALQKTAIWLDQQLRSYVTAH